MADVRSQKKDEVQKPNISAYLQAPRKKRRNFVVMATSENIEKGLQDQIEFYVRRNYSQLAVSHPKTLKELIRQFNRNISLLIIDDSFDTLENISNAINMLKMKSKKEVAPVLFLTKDPQPLITAYQKKLAVYQEHDDYCDLKRLNTEQVIGRVKIAIEAKNKRRSRRFKVDTEISLFHLTKNNEFKGRLTDLSMHGGMISCSEIDQFRLGDQIKLVIPVAKYIRATGDGEFLRLSAKVRRVFISGDLAGISFEHMSDLQHDKLTKFLIAYVQERYTG